MRGSVRSLVLLFVAAGGLFWPSVDSSAEATASWPDLGAAIERQGGGAKDAAVVIGIGDYDALPDIPGAPQNAADWERWLLRGRRVLPSRVTVLADGRGESYRPRKRRIQRAVETAVRQVQPGGTLWFVFIGHGVGRQQPQPETLLLAQDAARDDLLFYGVPESWLSEQFARAPEARVVMVVDACFSGKGTGSREDLAPGTGAVLLTDYVTPAAGNVVRLSAAGAQQFAGPLPGARRPAFSYLLLGGLLGWADRSDYSGDRDGRVTAGEALRYAREVLAALPKDYPQTPQVVPDTAASSGEVLAAQARTDGPDILALREALAGGTIRPPAAIAPPRPVEQVGTIAAEEGFLRVEGSPAGAKVVIEGPREFGTRGRLVTGLPYGPAQAPAGSYAVTVIAPGHDEETRRLELYADRTEVVGVKLSQSNGTLVLEGEPAGAKVELRCAKGFERVFGLPGTLTVPRGECTVQVSRSGFEPFDQRVTVAGGARETVRIRLAKVTAPRPVAVGGGTAAGDAGIEWIRIPGGTFRSKTEGDDGDRMPAGVVTVASFELAKSEVTVRQYRECVKAGVCTPPDSRVIGHCTWGKPGREDHPVTCVDWDQARTFCRWVGGRLPTEAEWEYAARSGSRSWESPWGYERATRRYAVMREGPIRDADD